MTPTELAQAIVDCGVGEIDPHMKLFPCGIACKDGSDHNWCTAEEFCTDGRVVLAMMELVHALDIQISEIGPKANHWTARAFVRGKRSVHHLNESLAIAINTACVEALNADPRS